MYVEFVGLPGSGKSTLSSALKDYFISLPVKVFSREEAIIKCLRRRDDRWFKKVFKLFPPKLWLPFMGSKFALPEFVKLSSRSMEFVTFLSKMLSESGLSEFMLESVWDTIARTFSETQLISQFILDSELAIMDEAFSQRCFTLFGYTKNNISDDLIYRYAKLASIADHVFWIATSHEKCVERFMLRYQSKKLPFDFKLGKIELLRNFESGNHVIERLTKALEDQGKCVYRIDADKNIKDSIMQIHKVAPLIFP